MEQNEKLNKLYSECINELANIKIEFKCKDIVVKISKRAHKRYGCCKPEIPDSKYPQTSSAPSKGFAPDATARPCLRFGQLPDLCLLAVLRLVCGSDGKLRA